MSGDDALTAACRSPAASLFPSNIPNTIGVTLRWSASSHGIDPTSFASHSLRSGGETALFIAVVHFEFMRRFGRWAPMRFRDYHWHDDVLFTPLHHRLISATGLTPHLKDENRSGPKRVRYASSPSFSMGSVICFPPPSRPFSFGGDGFT